MTKIFDVARNHDEQSVYSVNHNPTVLLVRGWLCVCVYVYDGKGYIEFA